MQLTQGSLVCRRHPSVGALHALPQPLRKRPRAPFKFSKAPQRMGRANARNNRASNNHRVDTHSHRADLAGAWERDQQAVLALKEEIDAALDKAQASSRRSMRMADRATQTLLRAKNLVAEEADEETIRQALQDKAAAMRAMDQSNERTLINLALAYKLGEAIADKQRSLLSQVNDLPNSFQMDLTTDPALKSLPADRNDAEVSAQTSPPGRQMEATDTMSAHKPPPAKSVSSSRDSEGNDILDIPISGDSDDEDGAHV